MSDRFTDRANKVTAMAGQEARRFGHKQIDTEHLLLGLFKEGHGTAAKVLKNIKVDMDKLLREVKKLPGSRRNAVTGGQISQTPRAKKVIGYAAEEAEAMKKDCIGTEHILLGLLRETECVAATVLINLGLTVEKVREEIKKVYLKKQRSK
jgi:ATP-dependent Clp protease ATP-binding subunit ClpC